MKFLVLGATGNVDSLAMRGLLDRHAPLRVLTRDAARARALEFLPPWLAYDLKRMYAHFVAHGLVGTETEVRTLTRLLGHPPRSFEALADGTARARFTHNTPVAKS